MFFEIRLIQKEIIYNNKAINFMHEWLSVEKCITFKYSINSINNFIDVNDTDLFATQYVPVNIIKNIFGVLINKIAIVNSEILDNEIYK